MQLKISSRNKQLVLYGILLAMLLFLLKWLELRFIIINHSQEIFTGSIAILFTVLGIWLAGKLTRPKTRDIVIEKPVYITQEDFVFNANEASRLGLSKRELEVLQLMSGGLSNQEIADQLFVSLNTIKTHSRNIFEKLEVVRRTQAVEKAKRLNLIS